MFSPLPAKGKQSLAPEEWQKLWLDKYSTELDKRHLSEKESQFHYAIIRVYLAEHLGNPRAIEINKLKRFVLKQKNDIRQPLILFYTNVARSEAHVEALNALVPSKVKKSTRNKSRTTPPGLKKKKPIRI
jgi:hypothetical protein